MRYISYVSVGFVFILAIGIEIVQPTCVLESDFGFKINCAFKKSGLFRVRNLGGLKAHASIGFSLGDELGFEQSLTNLDPSRRRSVNVKNGVPPNLIADTSARPAVRQEKKAKQNRIMLRPIPTQGNRVNTAAVEKLTTLHKKTGSTMQPIMVSHIAPTPMVRVNPPPKVTMAKPLPMGVPPFKPLPPKEETLKVLPIQSTRKSYTPLQIPQSKGPGLAYQSENRPSHDQISKMVSQMTHLAQTPHKKLTEVAKPHQNINPFVPMPFSTALNIIPAPNMGTIQVPVAPINSNTAYSLSQNTISIQKTHTNPVSNVLDPVPHQVHDLANQLYPAFNTKKVDDYNTITGYGDDTTLKINKDDINDKIAEIAKAGNISMEAVEAAIALRQQQLLNKYAGIQIPVTTTTTTTTTEAPIVFQPQPEEFEVPAPQPSKSKRQPTSGKVMNAPREYYPVGYEKNFDDHFLSKVDLPDTNFHCGDQKYFPGLYGDQTLGCMVFHVCALTDDGLVMKSFLCPESTLFDQTILKCNWWFYVDCKNTQRLYDTNIPVSKSYQLMKALTFFSNYRKDGMGDHNGTTNPEDIEGIKEAITILENHEPTSKQQTVGIQIVTPEPTSDIAPVYRNNRNYKNKTRNDTNRSNEDSRIFRIGTSINFSNRSTTNKKPTDNVSKSSENTKESQSRERQHRRRLILNSKDKSTKSTTESSFITSTFVPQPTTAEIEIEKQEMISMNQYNQYYQRPLEQKDEKPIDHIDLESESTNIQDSLTPNKRIYRSSAEIDDKDQSKVNPTPIAKLVGEVSTPLAAIEKLDEAILGKSLRFKKDTDTIFVVTPEKSLSRDQST